MDNNPLVQAARWVFVAQTWNRQGRFYAFGERLQLLIGDDGKGHLACRHFRRTNLFLHIEPELKVIKYVSLHGLMPCSDIKFCKIIGLCKNSGRTMPLRTSGWGHLASPE